MPVSQFGEALLHQQAVPPYLLEKALAGDDIEHGIGRGHGELIATKSRAMRAGGHALGRFRGRQARADREAAAKRLGQRHDVGFDAGVLIGEQIAGAADAGLHFVENQQQAVIVAKLAQRAQEIVRHDAHATLAHHRLDDDCSGFRCNGFLDGVEIVEDDLIETGHRRAEAFEIFLVAGGRQRGERPAVERAFKGDDAVALGLARGELILASHLDRAFDRLGSRVLEEHGVGEAQCAQPLGQLLAFRDPVQVRRVPELLRLRGDRRDHMRMCVAQSIDGDAGGEVEIALALSRDQPGALAPLESEVDARIGRQQVRAHDRHLSSSVWTYAQACRAPEMNRAASAGGTCEHSIAGPCPVNRRIRPAFSRFYGLGGRARGI